MKFVHDRSRFSRLVLLFGLCPVIATYGLFFCISVVFGESATMGISILVRYFYILNY